MWFGMHYHTWLAHSLFPEPNKGAIKSEEQGKYQRLAVTSWLFVGIKGCSRSNHCCRWEVGLFLGITKKTFHRATQGRLWCGRVYLATLLKGAGTIGREIQKLKASQQGGSQNKDPDLICSLPLSCLAMSLTS